MIGITDLEMRPTSGISEADLVRGYRSDRRTEPCACGRVLSVDSGQDWTAIRAMLVEHYRYYHGDWTWASGAE